MKVTEMKATNRRAADRKRCRKMVIVVLFAIAAVSANALTSQWRQDDIGWQYQNENGIYLKSERFWVDGKCYYFNEDGYCLQSARTPDGYSADAQRTWIEGGMVQTREQSQDSSAIKQIDNVVATVPDGFVFHSSDERRIYMTSMDGNNLICIISESLADFRGYAKLVYTYRERVLDIVVEAELGASQSKAASHLASGSRYCYHYMDTSSLDIPGFSEVYARISGGGVQVVIFGNIISPLDTDRITSSLAFL